MGRGSNGYRLAQQNRQEAQDFAIQIASVVQALMVEGHQGPTVLARELNRLGYKTREGGTWHLMSVARVLKRLGLPSVKPKPESQVGTDHVQAFEKLEKQVEAGMYDQIVIK